MDMTPFIEIALVVAGVFATCAIVETIKHVLDSGAIKSQTAQGIQAMVAMTELSVVGSMAEETAEVHGTPTPTELFKTKTVS